MSFDQQAAFEVGELPPHPQTRKALLSSDADAPQGYRLEVQNLHAAATLALAAAPWFQPSLHDQPAQPHSALNFAAASAPIGDDTITGTPGNDTLVGTAGDDTIDGGLGADSMMGGLGNDTYVVDNRGDVVLELPGQGIDAVLSSVTYILGSDVENLVLTGSAGLHGTGNGLDNKLSGNSGNNLLSGLAGNDTLSGGAGDDILIGGSGNNTLEGGPGNDIFRVVSAGDLVKENAGEGIDSVHASVSFSLPDNVENLQLDPGTANINATGNPLDNLLAGNKGNNLITGAAGEDTLIGGGGFDTLVGGKGNDTYLVVDTGDVVIEAAGAGTDTVLANCDYTLSANIENLTLTGRALLYATGNTLANVLTGNSGQSVLNGGGGNDTLNGSTCLSADLYGGAGNDSLIGAELDSYLDGGDGNDTLSSSSNHHFGDESMDGGAGDDLLTAATATYGTDETMYGGEGNDTLIGGARDDFMEGGPGRDSLTGGAGLDIFALDSLIGSDTISDFLSGSDKINIDHYRLPIGNGDSVIDGATTIAGPGGFAASAEEVTVTQDISGGITAQKAATAIGSASGAYAVGQTAIFVVDNGTDSAVYYFKSADANAVVSASELTLLATLSGTHSTVGSDIIFY